MTKRSVVIKASNENAPTIFLNGDLINRKEMETYIRANVRTIADLEFRHEFDLIELIHLCSFNNTVVNGDRSRTKIELGNNLITVDWNGNWHDRIEEATLTSAEEKTKDLNVVPMRCSTCIHLKPSRGFDVLDSCHKDTRLKFASAVTIRHRSCPLKVNKNEIRK